MTWNSQDLLSDLRTMQGEEAEQKRVELEDIVPPPIELEGEPSAAGKDVPPRLPVQAFDEKMRMDPPELLGPKPVPRQVRKDMHMLGMIPGDEWMRIRRSMTRGISEDAQTYTMMRGDGSPL